MPLYVRTLLVTAAPEEVDAAWAGHRRHLAELRARGQLRVAGEFASREGCFDLFVAEDLWEAESIARASPLVENGLGSWMLREWVQIEPEPESERKP
jgi:uncharacterized protein YciI